MFLEKCKYVVKEKNIPKYIVGDVEISDSDRENSDKENSDEEKPEKKIRWGEFWGRKF